MKTHVLIITDASGSMQNRADDVRGGHNSYLDSLALDTEVEYTITSTVFDTRFVTIDTAASPHDATRFDAKVYRPEGATALLDAVGTTVQVFRSGITPAEGDKYLLIIQTDGGENASREWNHAAVAKLLAELEAEGWAVVFTGVGADGWADKDALGRAGAAVTNDGSSHGILRTYDGYTAVTRSFARGETKGSAAAAAVVTKVVDGPQNS